jgi:hypothetical protein
MQLTWPKRKLRDEDLVRNRKDDPFFLDPLSLRASFHIRDKSSRPRPHKPRKFKFVCEGGPEQKKGSGVPLVETRSRQGSACIQQGTVAVEKPIGQCTPGSPLLKVPGDRVYGEMRHSADILSF